MYIEGVPPQKVRTLNNFINDIFMRGHVKPVGKNLNPESYDLKVSRHIYEKVKDIFVQIIEKMGFKVEIIEEAANSKPVNLDSPPKKD